MEKRRIELRGLKATLLKSIIDWDAVPVPAETGNPYRFPVVVKDGKDGKVVELRPGTILKLIKPTMRVNLFYLQGLGPVDLVPTHDPLRARVVRRWKFRF